MLPLLDVFEGGGDEAFVLLPLPLLFPKNSDIFGLLLLLADELCPPFLVALFLLLLLLLLLLLWLLLPWLLLFLDPPMAPFGDVTAAASPDGVNTLFVGAVPFLPLFNALSASRLLWMFDSEAWGGVCCCWACDFTEISFASSSYASEEDIVVLATFSPTR